MGKSIREALAQAGLVNHKVVEKAQAKERERLRATESRSHDTIQLRHFGDEVAVEEQERFMRRAGREATKAGHNAGSREYLKRFTTK